MELSMDLNEELRLSYYRPLARLAEGREVWLVQHSETLDVRVKKVLTVYDASVYRRLKKEPVPGTPRIFEAAERDGKLTVIEEYVSGETLRAVLDRDGPLPEREALEAVAGLCRILQRLHGMQPPVIHRDIKPSNVIRTTEGGICLLDLNAARADTGDAGRDTALIGTQGYAAPEQYGFAASDARTDIYAAGILLRELLGLDRPQKRNVSDAARAVVERCTRMDPKQRYASASELLEAVETAAGYAQPERGVELSWAPPGFRGKIWWMIPALPGYYLLIRYMLELEFTGSTSPAVLAAGRAALILAGLAAVFYMGNWRGVRRRMRSADSPVWLRVLDVFLTGAGIMFLGVIAAALIGSLI